MSIDVAQEHHRNGTLPPTAGAVLASANPEIKASSVTTDATPVVRLSPDPVEQTNSGVAVDTVYMDNVDGGRRATQHLIQYGHRRIAFLGLHPLAGPSWKYRWSALREQGWREVMTQFGESVDRMVFQPEAAPDGWDDQVGVATAVARAIVPRRDVSAVVCANDHAAIGLLEALGEAEVPAEAWPSLVGFDGLTDVDSHVLTSMRLPWEDIGRTAAQLVWERSQGRLEGPPQHHELPMILVSRFGPQKDWSSKVTADMVAGL